MSAPFGPIALTLGEISKQIRGTFETFTDPRTGKNSHYTMVDAGLSAFSVFFMQSPSFLEHQRTLEQAHGENNARTLFGVHEIPTDNPIRTSPDPTPPDRVRPVIPAWTAGIQSQGCESRGRHQAFFKHLRNRQVTVLRLWIPASMPE
ncbi:MAG: hypothetical protein NTX45_16965 [Proteobacteria bacterium]|nr:hypothetical protein [Pseudomonadota bacterium]